jgi:hypothetical protein
MIQSVNLFTNQMRMNSVTSEIQKEMHGMDKQPETGDLASREKKTTGDKVDPDIYGKKE